MAVIQTWLKQDLQKPILVQYLNGTMFTQDNAGNLVGVEVFDNGAPASLSGSVTANVIRPDGGTVAISGGTRSGNKVSVVLPQAAYAVPGQISIIIKLTSGSTVTTLCALVVTVYRSSTETAVDPGTIIPSIQTLIAEIDAAVASIPADYSSLWTSLAPAFSGTTAYIAGQYFTYDGHVYRFTEDHPAGAFSSSDCIQVSIGNEISDISNEIEFVRAKTDYNDATATGQAISTTARWFLEGFAYGTIDAVTIRFRLASSITLEIWEKADNELRRIYSTSKSSATDYTTKTFNIGVSSKYPMMVSVISGTTSSIACIIDTGTAFAAKYTSDLSSKKLSYFGLSTYAGLNVTGYATYHTSISDKVNAVENTTDYNTNAAVGTVLSNTNRWFLNGFAYGYINKVSINCKAKDSTIRIELWELYNGTLTRVLMKEVVSYLAYEWNDFEIGYTSNNPVMVSVYSSDGATVYQNTDLTLKFNTYRTTDLDSTTLTFSDLLSFTGLCVLGFITYLSGGKTGNGIVVAQDGSADYLSIAAAVNAASDGGTVFVYPGTYTEPVEAWGKTVDIVGLDKNTCIIVNDTGNYSTPAVEIDSGRIANFTIISNADNPTCNASDTSNYMKDYCIHADHAHATGKTLIIENCIIKNNHRAALGLGGYANNTVIVRNCDIWSGSPPSGIDSPLWNKRGVLYFHNRQPSSSFPDVTGQKMRFINNTMYCEDIIALYIYDTCDGIDMDGNVWVNEMEVEFINNMICAKYANGDYKTSSDGIATPTEFTNDSVIGGTGFTDHLKLSAISYGNNIAYLNNFNTIEILPSATGVNF